MKNFLAKSLLLAVAAFGAGAASAEPVTLVKLSGLTGTSPAAETAVYRADLSVLSGSFAAISISDSSGTFGGAGGQFSGFDLDAIKLSTTNCLTAACVAAASSLNLFDFSSGVLFTPGSQRAPTDPQLFGTGATPSTVNNAIATLGAFDGFSSTATPGGFLSLGDNGSIAFNLLGSTSGAGLYLYIGEVGDNGEVAGSNINVLSQAVPEPATWAMMIAGFALTGAALRRRRATATA